MVSVAMGVWAGGESADDSLNTRNLHLDNQMSPNPKRPTQDTTPHLVIHPLLVVIEYIACWEIVSAQSDMEVQLNLKVADWRGWHHPPLAASEHIVRWEIVSARSHGEVQLNRKVAGKKEWHADSMVRGGGSVDEREDRLPWDMMEFPGRRYRNLIVERDGQVATPQRPPVDV